MMKGVSNRTRTRIVQSAHQLRVERHAEALALLPVKLPAGSFTGSRARASACRSTRSWCADCTIRVRVLLLTPFIMHVTLLNLEGPAGRCVNKDYAGGFGSPFRAGPSR